MITKRLSPMAASLVALPDTERLSARVIRILGGNPGKFTLQGTNTYLVGQGPKRLLIDTGEGKPQWTASIKQVLEKENATIERALITHWHPDHVGGIQELLKLSSDIKVHKNNPEAGWLDIHHGDRFTVDGATLRAFHSPGHTTDHMALILEEEDAMFTGDNVLGQGTAVFEDLSTYVSSLEKMSNEINGRAYPGHGPVIENGKAKILEYIEHRRQRENQVLAVLGSEGQGEDPVRHAWGSMDIVKIIYKDVPENLHVAAERGVLQVLNKLEKEAKVSRNTESNLWTLNGKATL